MKVDVNSIIDRKVSFQKDTWSTISKEISISEILNEISSTKYESIIDRLRKLIENGHIDAYKAEKLRLPAVTFCATFNEQRKKEHIKEYNFIIVIDIDKLDQNKLRSYFEFLASDEYIFALWISPSNSGIKGLVALNYDFELTDIDYNHKIAFLKLKDYFFEKYEIILDSSGNDTTRLCYVTCDQSLLLKSEISTFKISKNDTDDKYLARFENENKISLRKIKIAEKKSAFFNPNGRNKNIDRKMIKEYIHFLSKKRISIAEEYEDRYRIAYAIANSFTYDIGKKYFIDICKINKEKMNEDKYIKLLDYCYENNTGWIKFDFVTSKLKDSGYIK